MKYVGIFLSYLGFAVLGLAVYYHGELGEFLHSLKGNNGVLITFWNKYLKNADSWNFIYFCIFVTSLLVSTTFVDSIFTIAIRKLHKKFPSKKFLAAIRQFWFRMTFQIWFSFGLIFLFSVMVSYFLVDGFGKRNTVASIDDVRDSSTVLLLGCNKYMRSDTTHTKRNVYYTRRIERCKSLLEKGKAKYFVVSGDRTAEINYDETRDMKEDLMALGVPEKNIKIDTSGLRTHDSMLRLRQFCAELHTREVVIVSQGFHVPRAVFMAPFFGIQGIGCNAEGTATPGMAWREMLAKPKVIIDLFLTNIKPKDGNTEEYRERFAVTSDLDIILILCVFAAFVSTIVFLVLYIMYVEKATSNVSQQPV